MSRAFVDESDSTIKEDDIPELVIPLPFGVKNYMTPKGAETVKRELQELERTVRPQLASQVSKNVTDGDSVNSEMVVSIRRKMRVIDRRVEYLTKMIGRIVIIDPNIQESDRVRFGAPFTWTQWVKLLARLNAGLPAEVTVLDRLRCLRQTRWGERWGRLKLAREVYQLSVTRRPVWLRQE